MERGLITHDFSLKYVAENGSRTHALALHRGVAVGRAGGLDPAVDARAGRLPVRGHRSVPRSHRRRGGRLGVAGRPLGRRVLLRADARPGQSVPHGAGRAGRRRPGTESVAAEPPADGVPPADAVPRLRRLHRAVRLRHRRAGDGPPRRGLAGRDPALDVVRVGFLVGRHPARRVVVIRGAGVGRLLGVGSGRERIVPALAHGDRVPPLGDGAGAPRDVARVEPVAAHRDVQPHDPRHVPHPIGCPRFRAQLHRIVDRPTAADVLRCGRRRWYRPHRVAGRPAARAGLGRLARCRARAPSS